MKYIFFLFFSLTFFFGNSQDNTKPVIYLDQELNSIDAIDYYQKEKSAIYRGRVYDRDSVIVKRLLRRYDFVTFNPLELEQVRYLLNKELGVQDFEKNIMLIYVDSILGYNEFNKSRYARARLDQAKKVSKKEFLKRRKSTDSKQKKCQKVIKKFNVSPYYVYSEKINFDYNPKHYEHKKISNALKSAFFKYEDHGIVILNPDGTYFYYKYLYESQLKRMLNNNWDNYINEFNLAKEDPSITKLDFEIRMTEDRRKKGRELAEIEIKNQKNERALLKKQNQFYTQRKKRISISIPNCYGHVSY